jgi:uncharacterized protein YegP (UPF0339 family)
MIYKETINQETYYYVRTKTTNSLILTTSDEALARRIENAISSVKDDSQIRIKPARGNKKGP